MQYCILVHQPVIPSHSWSSCLHNSIWHTPNHTDRLRKPVQFVPKSISINKRNEKKLRARICGERTASSPRPLSRIQAPTEHQSLSSTAQLGAQLWSSSAHQLHSVELHSLQNHDGNLWIRKNIDLQNLNWTLKSHSRFSSQYYGYKS